MVTFYFSKEPLIAFKLHFVEIIKHAAIDVFLKDLQSFFNNALLIVSYNEDITKSCLAFSKVKSCFAKLENTNLYVGNREIKKGEVFVPSPGKSLWSGQKRVFKKPGDITKLIEAVENDGKKFITNSNLQYLLQDEKEKNEATSEQNEVSVEQNKTNIEKKEDIGEKSQNETFLEQLFKSQNQILFSPDHYFKKLEGKEIHKSSIAFKHIFKKSDDLLGKKDYTGIMKYLESQEIDEAGEGFYYAVQALSYPRNELLHTIDQKMLRQLIVECNKQLESNCLENAITYFSLIVTATVSNLELYGVIPGCKGHMISWMDVIDYLQGFIEHNNVKL